MNTVIDWREQGGSVIIGQPGPGAARLFGVPFLAAGGYLFYQFFDGVIHPGELTIAGWTLLPLVAAAFFVPGWLIAAFRKRTVLTATSREVVEEYDFWVYTYRHRSATAVDATLMLRYERGSARTVRGPLMTTSTTTFWIHVYLVSGERLVLLALFRDGEKSDALSFAERVARYLKVGVRNRLMEKGEVNAAGVVVDAAESDGD